MQLFTVVDLLASLFVFAIGTVVLLLLILFHYLGLPIHKSLPSVTDMQEKHGLKERIKVIASRKLITPAEVAWTYRVGVNQGVSLSGGIEIKVLIT